MEETRPPESPSSVPQPGDNPATAEGTPAPVERNALVWEQFARQLLIAASPEYAAFAARVLVRWNPRMRSTAGMAYPTKCLITLNPRLTAFGDAEIERTLRHELAHLLAHHRAGKRRIAPHGVEWQQACRDLGLPNESRCHTLPLPRREVKRPHVYSCPKCGVTIHRARPLRRKSACLACCQSYAGGRYDERFKLIKS
jgi:predicted SprT family Zn-dependent metalloprotease